MKRLALGALIFLLFAVPANAWWTRGRAPPCDYPQVIIWIQQKFSYADRKTWHWGLTIERVTGIYETPNQIISESLIKRRYCRGTAWLSDGRKSEVVYFVESRQGFASLSFRVQSCLPEYDPWHTYDGWCRAAKP